MFNFFDKGKGISQENENIPASLVSSKYDYNERSPTPLSVLISSILCAIIILTYGGFYLYSNYLQTNVFAIQEELTEQASSFRLEDIENIISFSKKVENSNKVFRQRVSIPSILSELEKNIVRGNFLLRLSFSRNGAKFKMTFSGEALHLRAYLQQATQFKSSPTFQSGEISSPVISEGVVKYSFTLDSNFDNIPSPFQYALQNIVEPEYNDDNEEIK